MKRILVVFLTVCLLFSLGGCMVGDNYYGKGYSTIEEAWEKNGPNEFEKSEYAFGETVEKFYFDAAAVWIYITQDGCLASADFVYQNESWWVKGKGHYGSIAELAEWYALVDSDKDHCYLLSGTNVLFGSRIYDGKIICVNGVAATTKTYTLTYGDAVCLVDYWYIEDCKDYDYDSAVITYLEQSQNIA